MTYCNSDLTGPSGSVYRARASGQAMGPDKRDPSGAVLVCHRPAPLTPRPYEPNLVCVDVTTEPLCSRAKEERRMNIRELPNYLQ